MRSVVILFFIIVLFLYGCANQSTGKNCNSDKECLKSAFLNCEQAYGRWEGDNGNIEIQILGNFSDNCNVSFWVAENGLEITNKSLMCSFTRSKNISSSNDCRGELKALLD